MEVSVNKSSAVSFLNNNLSRKRMIHLMVMFALTCALFLVMMHGSWAADAKDLLQPGDETVKATFGQNSSMMTWLLIGEVVTGILAYVMTKNIKVLFGVIVLSVFINIAFAIIG
jgi:type IV conjugative transfer system pilin TraA